MAQHRWTKRGGRAVCEKCQIVFSEAEVLGELDSCSVEEPLAVRQLLEHIKRTPASEYRREGRGSIPLIVIKLVEAERQYLVNLMEKENEKDRSNGNPESDV